MSTKIAAELVKMGIEIKFGKIRQKDIGAVATAIQNIAGDAEPPVKKTRTGLSPETAATINAWLWEGKDSGGPKDAGGLKMAWAHGNLLFSYGTVLAKLDKNTLYVNSTIYTHKTGAVRNYLVAQVKAANEQGAKIDIVHQPEGFFKTSMPKKVAQRSKDTDLTKKYPFLKFK